MIEFERKFLVDVEHMDQIMFASQKIRFISQGYVCSDKSSVVRIRKTHTLETLPEWYVTIKSETGEAGKNFEFEYQVEDGSRLFEFIDKKIVKTRYEVPFGHLIIEVDVFYGKNEGLIIAEVELANDADSQYLTDNLPDWFGKEVTGQVEYSNKYLSTKE